MSFEDRLLHELRRVVAADPAAGGGHQRSRTWGAPRRLALAGAGALLVAVAAVAAVQLVGGAEAAYAVTKNADGTVTVEISSLKDAAGLQQKLRDAGINAVVQYLPPGKACREPWPTVASGTAAPGTKASPGGEKPGMTGAVEHTPDHTRFTISNNLPADSTLVITTQVGGPSEATGPSAVGIALAHGEVQPCEVVDAPAGSPPFGAPPAGAKVHTEGGSVSGAGVSSSDG